MKEKIEKLHKDVKERFQKEKFPQLKISLFENHSELISSDKTAFFPYGYGLWNSNQKSKTTIMVLGQDFGNDDSWIIANSRGEKDQPTLKNLKYMISEFSSAIEIEGLYKCFFTNCYFGLRINNTKSTGPFLNQILKGIKGNKRKKFKNKFIEISKSIFQKQLDFIKPSKILILGKEPAFFISEKFKLMDWSRYDNGEERTLKSMIRMNSIIKKPPYQLYLIPHPSNWKLYCINNKSDKILNQIENTIEKCFLK